MVQPMRGRRQWFWAPPMTCFIWHSLFLKPMRLSWTVANERIESKNKIASGC